MTRAASCATRRVANGAAIACSSVTTVTPLSGLMVVSSLDYRARIHGQPAFVVLGPQPEGVAIRLRLSAHKKVVDVETRAHRSKFVTRYLCLRQLVTQEIQQERCDQRTMNDQAGIAFDRGDVAAVIVNAVSVERQGRVTEKQYVVRNPLALPRGGRRRFLRWRRDVVRLGCLAVDNIVELSKRDVRIVLPPDLMANL